jgi:hypothetical protein
MKMERRSFLKGVAAVAAMAALPKLSFSTESIKRVLWDSGYQPAFGRMKIYSDMTWERYSWLGLGHLEGGIIEDGQFIMESREKIDSLAMDAFSV